MIAMITGLEKSRKYTSTITKAAMTGSARMSFVRGVNPAAQAQPCRG